MKRQNCVVFGNDIVIKKKDISFEANILLKNNIKM